MDHSEAGRLGGLKSSIYMKKLKADNIRHYDESPKRCKECNLPIPYLKRENDFCNHSCATKSSNKGVRKHGLEPLNCLVCSKKLKGQNKFCSRKCNSIHIRTKMETRIRKYGGNSVTPARLRQFLIRTRGLRCEICGITKWTGSPVPVVVDHIDGNPENGNLSNLRLTCPNCGALLPTYTGRNLGNGRHYRRQRYSQGKSS